jgi:hypothetical protein
VLVACIIALGAVIFALLYNGSSSKKPAEVKTLTVVGNNDQQKLLNIDSDNDGLKDWEETVWGTDSHNPDMDGDGTKDGDEIKQGRNPLVKGPNDSLKNSAYSTFPGIPDSSSDNSQPTGSFGKQLFATYMEYKQNGQDITPDVQQQIVGRLLNSNDIEIIASSSAFSQAQLNIVADTKENFQNYGNAVGTIFINDAPKTQSNELVILEDILAGGGDQKISQMDSIISIYKKLIPDLLRVKTPRSAAASHLAMINGYNDIIAIDEKLKLALVDPLNAFQAISNYTTAATNIVKSIREIRDAIINQGITYSDSDPGYVFIHI